MKAVKAATKLAVISSSRMLGALAETARLGAKVVATVAEAMRMITRAEARGSTPCGDASIHGEGGEGMMAGAEERA